MDSIPVIDYTAAYRESYTGIALGIIGVFGRDSEVLILTRRNTAQKRYSLEYRQISRTCCNEDDRAWSFSKRSIFSTWARSELPDEVFTEGMSLFDVFAAFHNNIKPLALGVKI